MTKQRASTFTQRNGWSVFHWQDIHQPHRTIRVGVQWVPPLAERRRLEAAHLAERFQGH